MDNWKKSYLEKIAKNVDFLFFELNSLEFYFAGVQQLLVGQIVPNKIQPDLKYRELSYIDEVVFVWKVQNRNFWR